MNKSITSNQVTVLLIICGLGIKISLLPGLMSVIAGNDIWIVALALFAVEGALIFLILSCAKKYPDMTFFQIIEDIFHIPVQKALEFMLLVFFIFKFVLSVYETEIFIKTTIYERFNEWVFMIPFLMFIFYVSMHDYNVLGRVSEIIIYCAILGAVVSLVLSTLEVNPTDVLPILKEGALPVVKCIVGSGFWFGDYLIVLLLVGNIKYEERITNRIITGYLLMVIFLVIFLITFVCLFRNTSAVHLTAISDVGHYYPRFNDFRLDWISDVMWILIALFSTGVYFCFVRMISYDLFGISQKNIVFPIGLLLAVLFATNVAKVPITDYVLFLSEYCLWLPVAMILMPLLMFVGVLIKCRRKKYGNAS